MLICGIKTTHDAGVALIEDGQLIFSCELEKLDNNERYSQMDDLGIIFEILANFGYDPHDIDEFVFDGWHKRPRPNGPFGQKTLEWFGQEISLGLAPYRRGLLSDRLFDEYRFNVFDLEYSSYAHYAGHAASAYCTSPFARRGEDAYVLTWDAAMFPYLYIIDGQTGMEKSLGALFPLIGNTYHTLSCNVEPFDQPIEFPRSLGVAGKVMAYIAKGDAQEKAIESLNELANSAYRESVRGRRPGEDIFNQFEFGVDIMRHMGDHFSPGEFAHADMLASIHAFLERKLVSCLRKRVAESPFKIRNLCIAGGCALNIKWNSAIRSSGMFDEVWVPPFPNDSGSAIGTACCAMMRKTGRRALDWSVYSGPLLRPTAEVPEGWAARDLPVEGVAKLLHTTGKPIIFLSGRAELGPRALGNRSIFAPATGPHMKETLNIAKGREDYRPVAPICLEHHAPEIFDPGTPDPYMLFDHAVRADWIPRIPAVCHLDNTARLQTVNETQNPLVTQLIEAYEELSGLPLLCNTSANFKGRGFFPDAESAMRWGSVPYIWSEGVLYFKSEFAEEYARAGLEPVAVS
jgi:carbamoyltransferase